MDPSSRRDFLLSSLAAGPALAAAQTAPEGPRIVIDVTEVTAPVTVVDRDGKFVNGLEPRDFTLLDNTVAQDIKVEVTWVPISLVLAVQANNVVEPFLGTVKKLGSMLESLVIGQQGECAVMAFDHRIRTMTDGFVQDSAEVKRALEKINPGSTTSALIDTVFAATRLLRSRPKERRRILLLVAETRDKGSEGRLREALLEAQIHNIIVYSININRLVTKLLERPTTPPRPSAVPPAARPLPAGAPQTPTSVEQNTGLYYGNTVPVIVEIFRQVKAVFVPNTLEVLTQHTGGREFSFLSQRDLEEVVTKLGEEVHSQYLITYSPSKDVREQGGWHEIKVQVARGLKARTRPGYWRAAEFSK